MLADRDGFATQMTRVSVALRSLDIDALDGSTIPWDTLDDWVLQGEEREEVETCNTVERNCLAPAGIMNPNGGISYGTEAADGECVECGEPLCSECADDEGYCGYCSQFEEK